MKRVLFQGDSITDCYRAYDNDPFLGSGYAQLVASELKFKYGNEYEFLNKGISGNRSIDLLARIKSDFINLKPDYLSILIGVNDVWHGIDFNNGVNNENFEKIYEMIIENIKAELPDTKIFLLEPFVFNYTATKNRPEDPDRWESIKEEVLQKAVISKKVASKYGLPFIELQEKLDALAKRIGIENVTLDGVHPVSAGHYLIANEWIKCFEENFR